MSSEQTTTRIILVDDEELLRSGLALILDGAEGIEVVGQASNGRDAVPLIERERPDVVLMDIRMPVMDGITAVETLAAHQPVDQRTLGGVGGDGLHRPEQQRVVGQQQIGAHLGGLVDRDRVHVDREQHRGDRLSGITAGQPDTGVPVLGQGGRVGGVQDGAGSPGRPVRRGRPGLRQC